MKAQDIDYMFEIGAGGGISWNYGDVNRSKVIYKPSADADIVFRYNANPRWAFVGDISSCGLKGESKDFDNVFPNNAQYSYSNRFWQIAFRPEFHFWNYGWANDYRERKHFVPFLTAGAGFGFSTGDGDTGAAFCIPLGAGLKYKIAPRLNAQLTCLFTRTFGDNIDGIKDPYGVGSNAIANSDWIGSVVLTLTFDFKERCIECHNQKE